MGKQFWIGLAWGVGSCVVLWAIVLGAVAESDHARHVTVCWRPGNCVVAALAVDAW